MIGEDLQHVPVELRGLGTFRLVDGSLDELLELSSWSPVWHTPPPKPRQRLIPTTDSDTPDLDMLAMDTTDLDTPDWDTMASVRLRPSLKLRLMLRLIPTMDMGMDLDMLVLDMLDLDIPDWDTMASVRLKLSLSLRLIPTTDLDTLDLDMLVLDTLVLDTPDWDTLVLDTPGLDTPGLDTLVWDIMAVDTTMVRGKTPDNPGP